MKTTRTIGDVASIVRSKNAGPFWQTLDIFCDTDDDYNEVAEAGVLGAETIARLYGVDANTVRVFLMPALRAVKISFPRPTVQGGIHDRDVHAGQQHVPLLALELMS
jgi:hypothetical protein